MKEQVKQKCSYSVHLFSIMAPKAWFTYANINAFRQCLGQYEVAIWILMEQTALSTTQFTGAVVESGAGLFIVVGI